MKYNIIYTRQATRKAEPHHSWLPVMNINIENNNTTQAEWPIQGNKSIMQAGETYNNKKVKSIFNGILRCSE
jgi:hypothetical protein